MAQVRADPRRGGHVVEDQIKARVAATDANDMLYQFNASRDYDPSPHLEKLPAACSPSTRRTTW